MQAHNSQGDIGPAASESTMVDRIVSLQRQLHAGENAPGLRAQHPKHQGLAAGELEVVKDLDKDLCHGVFAAPGTYKAWARFSNGHGDNDARATVRGCALKITGIDHLGRPDQDFLMIDHPVFFIKSVRDYVDLFTAQVQSGGGFPRSFVFPSLNPFSWRLRDMGHILSARKKRGNLLGIQYWSTTPYRLGPHTIKFSLVPRPENGGDEIPVVTTDGLRDRLCERLKSQPAVFDLKVQLQTDPQTMPVEDPTVNWDDARPASPWRKVATLTLPAGQNPASPERLELAKNMAFSPWHCLPAHEPLGGINRVRKAVYDALSHDRLKAIGRSEPILPNGQH